VEGSNEFLTYNTRVKKQFEANPNYLKETVFNQGRQAQKLDEWFNIYKSINEENDIEVTLIILPHCAQVASKYSEKMKGFGAVLKKSSLDSNYTLYETMKSSLPKTVILNPLGLFQKREREQALYFDNDPHLNEYGQTVLAQFLIEKKLFDEN
jgi:hypothetical protein